MCEAGEIRQFKQILKTLANCFVCVESYNQAARGKPGIAREDWMVLTKLFIHPIMLFLFYPLL